MTVEVRRAADRFTSIADGIESRHSLSFSHHYDPERLRFGAIIAHNEERVAPGAGFAEHGHRHVEIVTWVLEGVVEHRDDAGRVELVAPGQVQYLGAGDGVRHSERNAVAGPSGATARFVQTWLDAGGVGARGYQLRDVAELLVGGPDGLPVVAASRGLFPGFDAADVGVSLARPGAALRVGRLAAEASVVLPAAARVQVFVARGAIACDLDVGDLDDLGDLGDGASGRPSRQRLGEGDQLELTDEPAPAVTALSACELLVWELHDSAAA